MGFGLIITVGEAKTLAPDTVFQWLVEARVEMELSKPTLFALRFEDDICEGKREIADANIFSKDTLVGLFVVLEETKELECLVYGPVTKIRASSLLGGPGSWVEIHGEDRRVMMGRKGVQGTYSGLASATASAILSLYGFTPDTQDTLIKYDTKDNQLTQSGTDLAFIEDIARRNNMDLWIEYKVTNEAPIALTETAKLRTSPERTQQAGAAPQVPTLAPDTGKVLRVNPPADKCPNINTFDTRINFEKPTSASGFAMSADDDKAIVKNMVDETAAPPVDTEKPAKVSTGKRETIATPKTTPQESFLAQEALVFEQSWFVEADCSATRDQLGFIVRPHQIVKVANAGDPLSGGYQVMKATHVVNPTDHFIDFTIRANGLGGVN